MGHRKASRAGQGPCEQGGETAQGPGQRNSRKFQLSEVHAQGGGDSGSSDDSGSNKDSGSGEDSGSSDGSGRRDDSGNSDDSGSREDSDSSDACGPVPVIRPSAAGSGGRSASSGGPESGELR